MTEEELLKKIEEKRNKKQVEKKGIFSSISNVVNKIQEFNNNHIQTIKEQEKERKKIRDEFNKSQDNIKKIAKKSTYNTSIKYTNQNNSQRENTVVSFAPKIKKTTTKTDIKSKLKKGLDYEKFVGEHFESLGCIVKFNGIEKGKKDSSIDLIAINKDEIIFIQCKNWSENSRYTIKHTDIKAFVGDISIFLEENKNYNGYKIKRLFVASNEVFDKSAKMYCREHKDLIQYLHLPMGEKETFISVEVEEKSIDKNNTKLTTYKLAKKLQMKTDELNKKFIEQGYLEEKGTKLYLTQKGKEIGAIWKPNKFGGYILWDEDTKI